MPIEDELRVSLHRAARSADPSTGAFERLAHREPEPPRGPSLGSRLAAGAVATVVAVGAFAFVTSAFDEGTPDVAEPAPVAPDALRGSAWVVLRIDGESALDESWFEQDGWLTVAFGGAGFRAVSGCNHSFGSYEIVDGVLASSGGSTTTASCAGSEEQRGSALFEILRSSPTLELRPAALTLTTPSRSVDLQQDPCTLLSEAEVASATGVDPEAIGSDLVPPSGFKVRPEFGPACRYGDAGAFSSVIASTRPISIEGFSELQGADPSNTIVVDGIGDGAFIDGMSGISVLDGGRLIQLGLQHGAGRDAIPVLEALARAAVGRDDPAGDVAIHEGLLIEIQDGELIDGVQHGPTVRASFGGRAVPLQAIETPGDELAYPTRDLGVAVPLGTRIQVLQDGYRVRVRELVPAGHGELVERAAAHDGELVAFDQPGRIAISVAYSDDVGTGELGLIVHVLEGGGAVTTIPLADGTAGDGSWSLSTFGTGVPEGVELTWFGEAGATFTERVTFGEGLRVGTMTVADRGDPDDEIVFGVAPPHAVTARHVPGQGLPETETDVVVVPDSQHGAFVLTTYAAIGVVAAFDSDQDHERRWWRTLIVPPGADAILATTEAFLDARIAGQGAERFLIEGDASRFTIDGDLSDDGSWSAALYGDGSGRSFDRAVILFIDPGARAADGSLLGAEVGVVIEGSAGESEETLAVERQPDGSYLIGLARPGTIGP